MIPEISCGHCQEGLLELAAGLLAPYDRDVLERHLAICANCRRELARWQVLDGVVSERAQRVPPDVGAPSGWALIEAALSRSAIHHPEDETLIVADDQRPTQIDSSGAGDDEYASQNTRHHHQMQAPTLQWPHAIATHQTRPTAKPHAPSGWSHALPAVAAVLVIAVLSAAIFGWVGRGRQAQGVVQVTPVPAGCTPGQMSAQIPPHTTISALAMASSREGWAVGWALESTSPWQTTGVILRYSHCRWAPVEAQLQHMQVFSLSVLPSGEAWATGELDDYSRSFLLHQSGGVWQSVALPATVTAAGTVTGVRMLSANEGWLELLTQHEVNGQKTDFVTLAHYQAGHWTLITPPYPGITDLAPVGPDELWVTGDANNVTEPSYLAHYQAGKWVSTTVMARKLRLGTFGAVTPAEGWLSGTIWAADNSPVHMHTVMLHYDGHTWAPVDVGANPQAQEVVMFGASDGWAMTATTSGSPPINPFDLTVDTLQHDVGGHWQTVAWPWPNVTVLPMYGLFTRAPGGDYWAVGSYHSGATPPASIGGTVLLHYANGVWSMYGE